MLSGSAAPDLGGADVSVVIVELIDSNLVAEDSESKRGYEVEETSSQFLDWDHWEVFVVALAELPV